MEIINLTGKEVKLNDDTVYPVTETVVTVNKTYSAFTGTPPFSSVQQLLNGTMPPPALDTLYIVNEDVARLCRNRRDLCYIPNDHGENVYDGNGELISVPGLIRVV